MSQIYTANEEFPFDNLKLSKPTVASSGSYLINFTIKNSPMYIQAPKCKTKQGFLKAGKRLYTDLMFTNENYEFISWMETLENKCHQHLYENREKWFEGSMELHDIENYFTSPLKIFRTGKYYIARVFVQNTLDNPNLTIYDEDDNIVDINTINDKTDVISIIEIKGIKCTSTSFQVEMVMKQLLTVKPIELFSKCQIIKPLHNISKQPVYPPENISNNSEVQEINNNDESRANELQVDTVNETITDNVDIPLDTSNETSIIDDNISSSITENQDESTLDINTLPTDIIEEPTETNDELPLDTSTNTENETIQVDTNIETISNDNNELVEFQIDLDNIKDSDNISIKNKNDVYYEMYKEACRKAKIARDLALSSYLEAKRIKNTYMLDDISLSDDSQDTDYSDEESDEENENE